MASWCKNMCCLKGEDDDSDESEPDLISFQILTNEDENTTLLADYSRERDQNLIRACEEPLPNAPREMRLTSSNDSNGTEFLDMSTVEDSSSERGVDSNQSQNLENNAPNNQSPNSTMLGGESARGGLNVHSTLRWFGIPERNTRRNGEEYELPNDFWDRMELRLSMMIREEQEEDIL